MNPLIKHDFSDCSLIFTNSTEKFSYDLNRNKLSKKSKYFYTLFDMNKNETIFNLYTEHQSNVITTLFNKIYSPKIKFNKLDENCFDIKFMNNYISMLYYYQLPDSLVREYLVDFVESCEPTRGFSSGSFTEDNTMIQIKFREKFDLFMSCVKFNKFPFYEPFKMLQMHFILNRKVYKPIKIFNKIIILINTFLMNQNSEELISLNKIKYGISDFRIKYDNIKRCRWCDSTTRKPDTMALNLNVYRDGYIVNPIRSEGEIILSDGFVTFRQKIVYWDCFEYGSDFRVDNENTIKNLWPNVCYYGYIVINP